MFLQLLFTGIVLFIIFGTAAALLRVFVPHVPRTDAKSAKPGTSSEWTSSFEIKSRYVARHTVLTRTEMALFFELRKQIPEGYFVFPKMRIADILKATKEQGFTRRIYRILPRHVDFIVCDECFKPLLALELNGGYHGFRDVMKRDAEKREAFKQAGIPLQVITVGETFPEAVSDIFHKQLST